MGKYFSKLKNMKYEERLTFFATIASVVSFFISVGKLLIGIFSDYTVIAVGIFGMILVSAKIQCLLGIKTDKRSFEFRNTAAACLLFAAGVVYIIYMAVQLRYGLFDNEYDQWSAISMSTIAFVELGIAIYGLVRTKRSGHLYRNIKIISMVSAMSAMLTAQIAIMSFTMGMQGAAARANCISGINVGVLTVLLAVLMYFAPQISTVDRHHNVFKYTGQAENKLIDMSGSHAELVVVKSRIYGDYMYIADIDKSRVDGNLIKSDGMLKRLNIVLKVLFIILSEILIFVWLIGYAVYFVRTIDMPTKLNKVMIKNGFERIAVDDGGDIDSTVSKESAD